MAGEIDDKTQVVLDSGDNKDGVGDTATGDKTGPVIDDKAGAGSNNFSTEEILDEFGLDTPEDLKSFIANMKDLKGKIGDADLDELLENSKTLKKYQEQWAAAEAERLKESETPEQTIARLEREKKSLENDQKKQADRTKQSKAAKRAIEDFNETVTTVVKSAKEVPAEYRPFISEFLGVDNPINDVDISDKAAVRRLAKEGVTKMQAFEQAVIKRYRDGKIKIPSVSVTETTPAGEGVGAKEPKNLKEAKKIMMDSIGAFVK